MFLSKWHSIQVLIGEASAGLIFAVGRFCSVEAVSKLCKTYEVCDWRGSKDFGHERPFGLGSRLLVPLTIFIFLCPGFVGLDRYPTLSTMLMACKPAKSPTKSIKLCALGALTPSCRAQIRSVRSQTHPSGRGSKNLHFHAPIASTSTGPPPGRISWCPLAVASWPARIRSSSRL